MPVIIISSLIRGIGNACGGATMWAMVSDTIDYGEWKTGHRTEGLVNSACSFGYKIGNGIGSALLGIIIQIGGYVGDATVQSSSALFSIRLCFTWIPLAVFAACFINFTLFITWMMNLKELSGIYIKEQRKIIKTKMEAFYDDPEPNFTRLSCRSMYLPKGATTFILQYPPLSGSQESPFTIQRI